MEKIHDSSTYVDPYVRVERRGGDGLKAKGVLS